MKHIKYALLIALFSTANLVAAADSFQPQIIKGRIIEKGTGMPVSNATLWIRYFIEDAGREMIVSNDFYSCSDSGEFTITNVSDQVTRCDVELTDNNKYQESSISGPFEPGINDWGTFKVSVRPFYLERCYQRSNTVSAIVVNTTGKKAYMRFWLTGQLTRLDDSEYLGCSSEVLLELRRNKKDLTDYATYRLVSGKNNIELRVKDYGQNISVSGVTISGGRSYSEPMMPSFHVFRQIWLPPITNSLPPIHITNFPPIHITNFPPIWITNSLPVPVFTNPPRVPIPFPTNLPPFWNPDFPPFFTNLPPILLPTPTNWLPSPSPNLPPFPFNPSSPISPGSVFTTTVGSP
jgi:hypothetical protein